jgi:hypothetical protein
VAVLGEPARQTKNPATATTITTTTQATAGEISRDRI